MGALRRVGRDGWPQLVHDTPAAVVDGRSQIAENPDLLAVYLGQMPHLAHAHTRKPRMRLLYRHHNPWSQWWT